VKILYIGPKTSYSAALGRELEPHGYVLVPYSCEQKEHFSSIATDTNLVLLDNEYVNTHSDDDSISFIQKSIKDGTPIIFLSDAANLEARLEAFENGADDFVDKHFYAEIRQKIDSFLRPDLMWHEINTVLVEDDPISAKLCSHILGSKGAIVNHFSSAKEAYEYISVEYKKIDLILTDYLMPEMTGIELVKKIRTELGMTQIPIIFISTIKTRKQVLEFFKVGANDYIQKPLLKEEIYIKVHNLLENRIKSQILKKQVEQLEEINRQKDQLVAVCSHDLRTPLNTILGLSNMIAEDDDVEEEQKTHIKSIERSATDLLDMVNELLDVSQLQLKKDQLKFETVDLGEIVGSCIRGASSFSSKDINFSFRAPGSHAKIRGNKNMLIRAFNNILSNSYKFTPDGGKIRASVVNKKDSVTVTFRDSGIGIPDEFKEKIFDQMSGTGRTGLKGEQSIGLGMNIVKRISDIHNAQISLDSTEGKGTVITFTFTKEKA
jgi:signal transduction histidine kinase